MPQTRRRFGNHFAGALLALALIPAAPAFATTTYTYVGTNYSTFYHNCTPPGDPSAGPCIAYTASMHVQGWFSLDTALPANFGPADISTRSDLKWSFNDGVNTYASADTAHALIEPGLFIVQTDATGKPVFPGTSIALDLWETTPGVNNYFDYINIGYQPVAPHAGDYVGTGMKCFAVTGNVCTDYNVGPNDSYAASVTSGAWTVSTSATAPVSAPSLGTWATASLLLMLFGLGARSLRR